MLQDFADFRCTGKFAYVLQFAASRNLFSLAGGGEKSLFTSRPPNAKEKKASASKEVLPVKIM